MLLRTHEGRVLNLDAFSEFVVKEHSNIRKPFHVLAKSLYGNMLPIVIAEFDTREEAQAAVNRIFESSEKDLDFMTGDGLASDET